MAIKDPRNFKAEIFLTDDGLFAIRTQEQGMAKGMVVFVGELDIRIEALDKSNVIDPLVKD